MHGALVRHRSCDRRRRSPALTLLIIAGKGLARSAGRLAARAASRAGAGRSRATRTAPTRRSCPVLGGVVASRDRVVVETILLDHVARVRGIEHERLCAGAGRAGVRRTIFWRCYAGAQLVGRAASAREARPCRGPSARPPQAARPRS